MLASAILFAQCRQEWVTALRLADDICLAMARAWIDERQIQALRRSVLLPVRNGLLRMAVEVHDTPCDQQLGPKFTNFAIAAARQLCALHDLLLDPRGHGGWGLERLGLPDRESLAVRVMELLPVVEEMADGPVGDGLLAAHRDRRVA